MFHNPSIWKLLNPDLSIDEASPLKPKTLYHLTDREQLMQLRKDGYCFLPALIDPEKIDRMRGCIEGLIEKKIPPVFSFVYDLFWELILELDPVLRAFLQGEYLIIPSAWSWYVDSNRPKSYFPPHRDVVDEDFIDDDGMPTLFSLWIPLTDVTTQNSCIYLLPASRDPDYPDGAINWFLKEQQDGRKPWQVEDLVNIRALPAAKGSFMGWNGGVLHWASKPSPEAPPRISIGYYFHSHRSKKRHSGLIDLKEPLTFQKRMDIIFANLRMYGKSLESSAQT